MREENLLRKVFLSRPPSPNFLSLASLEVVRG